MQKEIKGMFLEQVKHALNNYGLVIAIFVLGVILGFLFKKYLADRDYKKQIELRFADKDKMINDLRVLVLEKLTKVEVEKKDKSFFNKLKKFFKKG